VPSISSSGGEVGVPSQWIYTVKSPQRVGYFSDEVVGMAKVSPQKPRGMKMTQCFWNCSSSAPVTAGPDPIRSLFDDHDPAAAYVSRAPMHRRVAFWARVLRPVARLM
jgi:hypothetical protein